MALSAPVNRAFPWRLRVYFAENMREAGGVHQHLLRTSSNKVRTVIPKLYMYQEVTSSYDDGWSSSAGGHHASIHPAQLGQRITELLYLAYVAADKSSNRHVMGQSEEETRPIGLFVQCLMELGPSCVDESRLSTRTFEMEIPDLRRIVCSLGTLG